MKAFLLFLTLWFACLSTGRSQPGAVTVEIALDQEQFLVNEDFPVAVRITNRSGQTLQLGKENDWLTFSVEGRDNIIVSRLKEPPVAGEFSLGSSLAGTKRVNLTPYFEIKQPGRYQVTATVRIPQWNQAITSRPRIFDIINGTRLMEFEIGLPPLAGAPQAPPEIRKYVLQQANYLNQMRLYLRLTDSTGGKTYKLFPIAPLLSFSKPEAQVDRFSNLHVLHQTGARAFNYCLINPEGQIIARQTHDYTATRPTLKVNDEGRIFVAGGIQRVTANDLPAPATPQKDANTQNP
jgi:hypothetical protein